MAPSLFGVGTEPNPHASKMKSLALGKKAWGKERGLRGAVRRCRKRSFHSRLGERDDPCHPRFLRVTEREGALVAPSLFGVGTEPNPHASKMKSLALGKKAWGKERGLRGAVRRCRKRSFHSRLGERDDPCHPRFLRVTEREGALAGAYRKAVLYSTQKGRGFPRPFCTPPCLQGVVCYTSFLLSGGKRMMFLLAQKRCYSLCS